MGKLLLFLIQKVAKFHIEPRSITAVRTSQEPRQGEVIDGILILIELLWNHRPIVSHDSIFMRSRLTPASYANCIIQSTLRSCLPPTVFLHHLQVSIVCMRKNPGYLFLHHEPFVHNALFQWRHITIKSQLSHRDADQPKDSCDTLLHQA